MDAPAQAQESLAPRLEVSCSVCGTADYRLIASAHELEAQREYLIRFHRRRLRPPDRPDAAHGQRPAAADAVAPDAAHEQRPAAADGVAHDTGPKQRTARDGQSAPESTATAHDSVDDSALEERADFTQNYATNIVACTLCGLILRHPRPPADAIAAAYAADTYGEERLAALYQSQVELFRPKAQRLQRLLGSRRDPVVLEIGSFVGGFLAAARELGWSAFGIDPGQEVVEFCAKRGLSVLREEVESCEFPAAGADCIAIWNTFDQLPNPHPILRSVRHSLRPGGILAVRVPCGPCFEHAMRWLRRAPHALHAPVLAALAWNNLLSFPYLHGYSLATLDRLMGQYELERVGFTADVLTRLADDQTRPWAACEERVLKGAWRAAARAAAAIAPERAADRTPWFDAYYRMPARAS
ncbi:MAG TPA: class I SAM-dependent methyltransferase [Candidatus Limnocylindrales bacterium]|nr:class I SAM-dependent methyltransferase [Candidatus Limnocylindrales bacterium]